jgi:hypothetical protein
LVRANLVGPDLTYGEKKPTACVALVAGLHLDGFGFPKSDSKIIIVKISQREADSPQFLYIWT